MEEKIILGDSFEEIKNLNDNSIDSLVTDPPYGMSNITHKSFMDCMIKWCNDDNMYIPKAKGFRNKSWDAFVPPPGFWKQVLRVLKPGSYGLIFSSSRTIDLMGLSLRIAGFEIRDCISWLYGEGFVKNYDIGKKIKNKKGYGTALKPAHEPVLLIRKPIEKNIIHNVLKWNVGGLNIDDCRIDTDEIRIQGNQYGGGVTNFGGYRQGGKVYDKGRFPSNVIFDNKASKSLKKASRFFYCAKSSPSERSAGIDKNIHPTVKPIEIMRYLCRLITPVDGLILEPFLGSGTTAIAANKENFSIIGIEREKEYYDIALKRIEYWKNHDHAMTPQIKDDEQLNLF